MKPSNFSHRKSVGEARSTRLIKAPLSLALTWPDYLPETSVTVQKCWPKNGRSRYIFPVGLVSELNSQLLDVASFVVERAVLPEAEQHSNPFEIQGGEWGEEQALLRVSFENGEVAYFDNGAMGDVLV